MFLTYATADDILTAHFQKVWNDETPIILKNQQPTDIPQEADAWVRFAVLMTASAQNSFGMDRNRRFLRMGRIFIQIFVRSGMITDRLNQLASKVIDIYEKTHLTPLRVLQILQQDLPDGASRPAKITADGVWFGTMVNVQFAFDEIK